MRSRLFRLSAVVVVLVGLLGTFAPPASADTTLTVQFVGETTLSGGLGYPIPTNLPSTEVPTTECLELNDIVDTDNCHPEYDHRRNILTITTTTCFSEGTNVNKPGKQPAFAHNCNVVRFDNLAKPTPPENTISGHCGLGGGQFTIRLVDVLGQVFFADIHFTDTNGKWALSGHWWKSTIGTQSNHGLVSGLLDAIPDPDGTTGSCTNKTATRFLLIGTMTFTPDPALP